MKNLKKKLSKIRQFIKYHLAKYGFFPQINSRIQLIENADLPKDFKESLKQMAYYGSAIEDFFKSYLVNDIQIVKKRKQVETSDPILICAVKNDLVKIKLQVEHHRKIGIKHFIYIDNISTDGTFEWLKEQDDVTLYKVETSFNARTKAGWWHLAIKQEGYDKWYLILDSDELFAYPGMETISIQKYINFLEKKQMTAIATPMVDMYSKGNIFTTEVIENIEDEYCFFDAVYYVRSGYINKFYFGGPRFRTFSMKNQLVKYSLLKMQRNMIFNTNMIFPFHKNFEAKVAAFLLHYKFLPNDMQKYIEIAEKGNYWQGSKEYKTYIEFYKQNPNLSFYYSDSQKLNSSMDLLKINIADKQFFEEFLLMKDIAILITVFNRKEKTISCLKSLFTQNLPQNYKIKVYLVDDGSTDGTAAAIKEEFPQVKIIQGDGNLYWNRGMYFAWENASKEKEWDFYLWLNDDVKLFENSLKIMFETSEQFENKSIIVGTLGNSGNITYGGRTKYGHKPIFSTNEPIECEIFTGNLVLIPKYVYELIGKNDPYFRHSKGDYDYGLRARKFGIKSFVAPGILGECKIELNSLQNKMRYIPKEFFVYRKRHYGLLNAIRVWLPMYLKLKAPNLHRKLKELKNRIVGEG